MNHKTLKDMISVVMGNGALLGAKVFTWLLIPRLLGIYEYGYYKMFTLYLTYMLFFHLGFPDGILLLHGGQHFEELDREKFRFYSVFFLVMQCIVGGIFVFAACILCDNVYRYILIMLAFDMVFVNLSTYFKFISQATMRFKELTIRNVFQSILQVLSVILIYILASEGVFEASGKLYIFSIVFIDGILFIWYLFTYRDIVFGKRERLQIGMVSVKKYFKTGILLTAAYQASHLIIVQDSQMVSVLYDMKSYSLYAFAYSIVNMASTALNAIATVLFPNLKRMGSEKASGQFPKLIAMVTVLAFFLLAGVYPLSWLVEFILPDYAGSLLYLEIIMPGLAISCCINLIFFTYYKMMGWLEKYLKIAILILIIGLALNVVSHAIYSEPEAYSIASVITLLIWYLVAEQPLKREFHLAGKRNLGYLCSMIALFYIVISLQINRSVSFLIYVGGFLFMTTFYYKCDILPKVGKGKNNAKSDDGFF